MSFCRASGQIPNMAKSSITFIKHVDEYNKSQVRNIFPVQDLSANTIYLGHPLIFNHSDKNSAYNFIFAKFRSKLTKLKANKLNHAGRLVYINSVLSSIPIYYMSTILFSKKFISRITSITRRFWWTGTTEENSKTGFHFRSWRDICRPKEEGGLGIRDLRTVNRSLLLNAAWKIATGKNSFLSQVLKAKYHPYDSFWKAKNPRSRSAFWSSILSIKETLISHCTVQIQKGNSSIWSTPWCPIWKEIHSHLKLPITVPNLPNTIADLWSSDANQWNSDLINQIFDTNASNIIRAQPVTPSDHEDTIRWRHSRKGECTTKDAFVFLNRQMHTRTPPQGARSISPEAINILKKVCKHKTLPPHIKTFMWRVIRRAIATGLRAGKLSSHISTACYYCGKEESDSHLFFHCDFARATWFAANPSICSSALPMETDGIQQSLILAYCAKDDIHWCNIIVTLWFIWIARNDHRFRNRKWSVS